MAKEHEHLLRRVRLELARDHDFPNGSSERGYDFIAPLDRAGQIDLAAWKDLKDRCRVRRFWAHDVAETGHVVQARQRLDISLRFAWRSEPR